MDKINIISVLASVISGIIGGMGLGGGAVLLIYLTVFASMEQINAQGINLLFFIPIGTVAAAIYAKNKQIKWKTVLPLAVFGAIGTLTGVLFLGFLGNKITSKIFGSLLILFGITQIFNISPLISRLKCGILKKE